MALLGLLASALLTASKFHPPLVGTAVTVSRWGMVVGAGLAVLACLGGFYAVMVMPRSRASGARALGLVKVTMVFACAACLAYGAAHAAASVYATTWWLRTCLLLSTTSVVLAAREAFRSLRFCSERFEILTAAFPTSEKTFPRLADEGELAEIAAAQHQRAQALGQMGLREEAVGYAVAAVRTIQSLAVAEPERHLANLGASLHLLSTVLLNVGENQRALRYAVGAVEVRRSLASRNGQPHVADLAMSLFLLSVCLRAGGDPTGALRPAEEGVRIWATLASAPGAGPWCRERIAAPAQCAGARDVGAGEAGDVGGWRVVGVGRGLRGIPASDRNRPGGVKSQADPQQRPYSS